MLMGLVTKSAAPSSKLRVSASLSLKAVTKITGMARLASSALRRAQTS